MSRRQRRPWVPADEIESLESLLAHCRKTQGWQAKQGAQLRSKILAYPSNLSAVKCWRIQASKLEAAVVKWKCWGDTIESLIGELTGHDKAAKTLLDSLEGEAGDDSQGA